MPLTTWSTSASVFGLTWPGSDPSEPSRAVTAELVASRVSKMRAFEAGGFPSGSAT